MKPEIIKSVTGLLVIAVLVLLHPNSALAARVIEGSLGSWIQYDAAPGLTKVLTGHPRFKGERIKIMGMRDGHPLAVHDELTERIKEQLTHDLLATAGIQIVFDDYSRCMPVAVHTILGIEVSRHNAQQHRVSLAMVDSEEGIWLNGTNLSWNGRLTAKQRRELDASIQIQPTQDLYSSHQTREIADALFDQLRCQRNITAPVYFEAPEEDTTRSVSRRLSERFSSQTQVSIDRRTAASIIYLKFPPTSNGMRELSLELATTDDPDSTHRIAEVAVTQAPPLINNPGTGSSRAADAPAENYRKDTYLSAIHYQASTRRAGICKNHANGCVEIDFELFQPAYVVLFSTAGGAPVPLSCDMPKARQPGNQQFRLTVPIGQDRFRPTVGVYALAFQDRAAAQTVQRELNRGAARCNTNPQMVDAWASGFGRVLNQYREYSEWRALHLTRDASGISTL